MGVRIPFPSSTIPKELYRKKNYTLVPVVLQKTQVMNIEGDWLGVVYSEADLSKVYIAFNSTDYIPLSVVSSGVTTPFTLVYIKCEDSEVGKKLILLVGHEAVFTLSQSGITITRDFVGLAKETTLSGIKSQADKLNFDSANRLRVSSANAEVILPVDVQARLKSSSTLYSGTVTSSGSSADIDVTTITALEIELKVTAVSGTSPTLSVYIEGKFEATGDYKVLVYQEGITNTGIWYFTINPVIFRYIRVRWVISGTSPSFTFTVAGQTVV